MDGTLGIAVIQSKLGYTEDEILLATHPAFGHKGDDGLMKRRFIIVDHIHPDQSKETRVAAPGGHSIKIWAPGHHSLGKESLSQLAPFTHRTSATKEILRTDYLCQQGQKGGINLSTGINSYKASASHEIEIQADGSNASGIEK